MQLKRRVLNLLFCIFAKKNGLITIDYKALHAVRKHTSACFDTKIVRNFLNYLGYLRVRVSRPKHFFGLPHMRYVLHAAHQLEAQKWVGLRWVACHTPLCALQPQCNHLRSSQHLTSPCLPLRVVHLVYLIQVVSCGKHTHSPICRLGKLRPFLLFCHYFFFDRWYCIFV
mmetsp:Transcript_7216/g.21288  ORF Transcript_7216/g.21288 Transcript_7216/m.21288 type:complete len:170 (-) Transcript_7216:372-881(-)